jgi:hypothetical protein
MRVRLAFLFSVLLISILTSCSSEPTKPAGPTWIHEPTRLVDNGYIVYVESAMAHDFDKATFKAEGLALSDLANECSFIPKGTRIEDRYMESQGKDGVEKMAYVKLAVEFQECDQAQKALQPEDIKKIASASFTQQLKRYQDYDETGDIPAKSEVAELEPLQEIPPAPARQPGWNDNIHFYAMRQYVVYQKEVVVLSPPTAYAPASPESQTFVHSMTPTVNQINTAQTENPALKNNPTAWSQLPNKPRIERPESMRANLARPMREGHFAPPAAHGQGGQQPSKKRKGKKHHPEK